MHLQNDFEDITKVYKIFLDMFQGAKRQLLVTKGKGYEWLLCNMFSSNLILISEYLIYAGDCSIGVY